MVNIIGLVNCSSCQPKIGLVIEKNGKILVNDGSFSVLVEDRFCDCCGRLFHWDGRNYTIEEAFRKFGGIKVRESAKETTKMV
jgi:hypothetical protein